MAGDPMQTEPQTRRPASAAFREWYVVTDGGSALRVTPGLTVGETDSGALLLNDPDAGNQWVEFVFADNGEPWATIVTRDKSLCAGGSTCLRHPLRAGATLRLPNNTLYISRDIRMPRPSETVVEVVHRDIPERLQDLVGPGFEEVLATVQEPRPDMPWISSQEPADPIERAPLMAQARPEPNRAAPDDWSDHTPTAAEPQRPQAATRRSQVAVMAGALALGAVTVAGVVAVLVSMGGGETTRLESLDSVTAPAEVVDRGSGAQAPPPPRPSDSASPAEAVPDRGLAEAPGPPPSRQGDPADSGSAPAADTVSPAEPAAAEDPDSGQLATVPATEPEPVEPIVLPPVERRSVPEAAQTADADEPVADPQPVDRQPDPALVAELEEIGERAQRLATELARRRDLLAADLALAQGRLTSPPEASAYTLYNRVLAVDPGSPEATSGLQSVREGLINRALAQLAGNDLDDARQTLAAAADAGADPMLISDLRQEVDHRERLSDSSSQ